MGSVNKVILVGNLGKDPEIRAMSEGKEVANLTIATSESWTDRASGEKKERTEWHRVVIFAPGLVSIAKQFLRKGYKIYLEGSLQTRKWQDQSGQERYTTEIVLQPYSGVLTMLSSTKKDEGGGKEGDYNLWETSGKPQSLHQERDPARSDQQNVGKKTRSPEPDFDDDIPF